MSGGLVVLEGRPYYNFINSCRSEATKKLYHNALLRYLKHYRLSIIDLVFIPPRAIEEHVINYLLAQETLSYQSRYLSLKSVRKFYEMNDITVNWKKVSCHLGESTKMIKDRAYTHKEIKTLVDAADFRFKAILLLLASTGVRIGAIPGLMLRNLEKIEKENLYKITIYENSREEYFTFCTPECAKAIDEYLEYRTRSGEKLSKDSPLIRKQFDINDLEQIRQHSQPVSNDVLCRSLDNHLIRCGLRTVDHTSRKRKEVARAHGFRKFTTTQLVHSKVSAEIREMLIGHRIGLTSSYYRPTEDEMLDEYMKAVDNLTINEENRLRKRVEKLEVEKNKFDQLAKEIELLKKKIK